MVFVPDIFCRLMVVGLLLSPSGVDISFLFASIALKFESKPGIITGVLSLFHLDISSSLSLRNPAFTFQAGIVVSSATVLNSVSYRT